MSRRRKRSPEEVIAEMRERDERALDEAGESYLYEEDEDGEAFLYEWPRSFLAGDPGLEDEETALLLERGLIDEHGRPTEKALEITRRANALRREWLKRRRKSRGTIGRIKP